MQYRKNVECAFFVMKILKSVVCRRICMISIEIDEKDLKDITKVEVQNLPGALFIGASPLLKPFINKLECILPSEMTGKGDSYTLVALHTRVDEVHANENIICVKGCNKDVEISRNELSTMMYEKYPSTGHQRLNLPGLLFLQSSPAIQVVCASKLRSEYKFRIPDGRRTLRYIFHIGVVSIDADKKSIKIGFDPDRLPKKPDGSCVLE